MTKSHPVAGILALQGDYQKHQQVLDNCGIESVVVREKNDFDRIDRLIIPGGESTVIYELLERLGLLNRFSSFIKDNPVWGTCAGMILLSSGVGDDSVKTFNAIDITVDRNGYGRQYFSTVAPADLALNGHRDKLDLVFIRAPRVTRVGPNVKIMMQWNDDPVLLSQGNILVSSFHPELTGSVVLHDYFARKFPG